MSFTGIYWVLLGFTGFYWVFILFQLFFFDITLVLMDFNGSNGFYRVWIESTQGWPRFARFFNSIRSWFYFFFYRDWLDAIGSKKVSAEFFEVPTRKFTEFYWVLSVFYGVPEWVHPNMVLLTFFFTARYFIFSFLFFCSRWTRPELVFVWFCCCCCCRVGVPRWRGPSQRGFIGVLRCATVIFFYH